MDKKHMLSLKAQCEALGVNRTSLYYERRTKDETFLEEEIVKIYVARPFYGYRRVHNDLKNNNVITGLKKVRNIRKKLNLKTLYPKPNTSVPNKEHEKYPYLLKNVEITRVNQLWETDITYLKLKIGFAFLSVIIDVLSRKTLSYNISNTMDVELCARPLREAIEKYGTPEILNSDQGSQLTSLEYTNISKENGIRISMNSRGRALDNVFIERFFRSLKYEDIYLKKYETLSEAKEGIEKYFNFYNSERGHQSLNYKTPDEVYYGGESSLRDATA